MSSQLQNIGWFIRTFPGLPFIPVVEEMGKTNVTVVLETKILQLPELPQFNQNGDFQNGVSLADTCHLWTTL